MGQRTRDRTFRRLEERSRTTAPLAIAWVGGAMLGAVGGLGFLAWEATVLQAAGVSFLPGAVAIVFAGLYAAIGALLGLLGGATGLWGPRWSLATAFLLVGWLLGGQLGDLAGGGGLAAVGVAFALVPALVLGQLTARVPGPGWLYQGVAALVLAGAALLAPLHQHLIDGWSAAGVVASLLVLLIALGMAGVTALFTGDERAPIVPLVLWALLGGAGAFVFRGRATPPEWPAASAAGPPLVVVVISGLRADRTTAGGYDRPTTPNLDQLQRRSLWFENAHATSNWSVPSIASLLSGRLPYAHGAGLNDGSGPTFSVLRPDVVTLPVALRAGGWATAGVTADPELRRYFLDTGFQTWHDAPAWGVLPALWVPVAAAGLDPLRMPPIATADLVTDRALELLATREGGGWMLFVHYADAADPFFATADDERAVGYTTRPHPADLYDAAVHRVDRELGRLLQAVPPEAWVVVAGDRGLHLSEQRSEASQGQVGERYGHTMFEELLHVPLLVRAPGLGAAKVPGIVSIADVAPTLAAAVGHAPLQKVDGMALERAFGKPQTDRIAIAQSSRFGPEQQAVILGRHKLVHTATNRTPLFDLQTDPAEASPLTTQGETDNLERRLLGFLPPPGAGANLQEPPSLVLRLGQLGSRFLAR